MKRSRVQLKAELMAQAEEVIDELLEWHEALVVHAPSTTVSKLTRAKQ